MRPVARTRNARLLAAATSLLAIIVYGAFRGGNAAVGLLIVVLVVQIVVYGIAALTRRSRRPC
jgi:hypothetical protein